MPKTEKHRILADRMRETRESSSSQLMSRAEFLQQTPRELRVTKIGDASRNASVER